MRNKEGKLLGRHLGKTLHPLPQAQLQPNTSIPPFSSPVPLLSPHIVLSPPSSFGESFRGPCPSLGCPWLPSEVPPLAQSASGSRWIDQALACYLHNPSQMFVEPLLAQQALGRKGQGGHEVPRSILPLFLSLRTLSPAGVFPAEA